MTKVGTRANLAVEISAGCKTFGSRSEPCDSASRGGEYLTGLSCNNYEQNCGRFARNMLEVFLRIFSVFFGSLLTRGRSLRRNILRGVGDVLESRIWSNARDVECVLFSCG